MHLRPHNEVPVAKSPFFVCVCVYSVPVTHCPDAWNSWCKWSSTFWSLHSPSHKMYYFVFKYCVILLYSLLGSLLWEAFFLIFQADSSTSKFNGKLFLHLAFLLSREDVFEKKVFYNKIAPSSLMFVSLGCFILIWNVSFLHNFSHREVPHR